MSVNLFDVAGSRGALLSECGRYRYRLWRLWDEDLPVMVWVLLNPSTANAEIDDPTLRKCIGFAKRHKHGGVILVNLFAWRATDPDELPKVSDPVGPENDGHILWALRAPLLATAVAGWGRPGNRATARQAGRVLTLMRANRPPRCFGRTKAGHPRHPLYVAYAAPLESL